MDRDKGATAAGNWPWRFEVTTGHSTAKPGQAILADAGDINYSGMPENAGPVVKGEVIACHIDKLPDLIIRIV